MQNFNSDNPKQIHTKKFCHQGQDHNKIKFDKNLAKVSYSATLEQKRIN